VLTSLLGSIPSPSSGVWEILGFRLRAYGLMIALGVVAAVWLAQRRAPTRGIDPDHFSAIAVWGVIAGLIGARLYHVITDWRSFEDRLADIPLVWKGGLGIPGGMLAGVVVGVWTAKRRGLIGADALDVVVPSLTLAQAIGRIGNWWNQELFGKPTDLPWGLEIDEVNRPAKFADRATFHPAFLYEVLWNLALTALIIFIDRKGVVKRGRLIVVYLVGYGLGRFWIELLRIDSAGHLFGVRVNVWVSIGCIVGGAAALVWPSRRDQPEPANATDSLAT